MANRRKHIIFDLDGTLIDTNEVVIESLVLAIEKVLGYTPSKESIDQVLGKPLEVQFSYFDKEKAQEMADVYREHYVTIEHRTFLFRGIEDLLKELRQKGHIMSVLTNKGRRGLTVEFTSKDLFKYFEHTVTRNDIERKKPDPYAVYMLSEKTGIPLEDTILVGDSVSDIMCGMNAGIDTLLVDWTIVPERFFEGLEYTARIEKPIDILEYVDK